MKKFLPLLLVCTISLILCACGNSNSTESSALDATSKAEIETQTIEASVETADAATQANDELNDAEGLRPEFKEAMDAYEDFYDEYCIFMAEYKENPTDVALLSKYSDFLTKAVDMTEAFEAWDQATLSKEELKYYLDVNSRVLKKLAEVAE